MSLLLSSHKLTHTLSLYLPYSLSRSHYNKQANSVLGAVVPTGKQINLEL